MRLISLLIMLLLFILSCSKKETTEPAPTTGTISGTVMNKAGDAAVPAAIVTTEPPTSSVSTDNQGKYTIEEVDPGDYIVQAVKDGFDPGNVNVTVKAGKTVTADIRMGILLANHPPTKPQLLAPENNSQYQSIDLQLQWKEAADPDGDAVVYDLYFGKENPPPLDMEDLDSTHVSKSNLDTATVYYWQVVAKDSKGSETASDLWQFKTTPNPIPTDGLIAYWPFNGNANDESGNGNDGTVSGAILTMDRFSHSDKAYQFDGNDDFISTNFKPSNVFTLSIWYLKNNSQKNNAGLLSTYKGFNYNGVYYAMNGSTDWIRCDGNSLNSFSSSSLNWKQIVIISDGARVKVYENTVKKLDFAGTTKHASTIVFGDSRYNGRFFSGKIDDIRIYNRVLNENEIIALFHEGGWQVR
ncbi:carboxypeptidase regulatory-like domain-containing protein [Calditrichota bacterium GD2]